MTVHPNNRNQSRQPATATATRGTRFILAGQKDVYQPGNPADIAEYQMILCYRQR